MTGRTNIIFTSLGVLALTLACATVTGIFSPEEPAPTDNITATPCVAPITGSTVEPVSCPAALSEIMDAAISGRNDSNSSDAGQNGETYLVTYEVYGDQITNPYYETIPSDLLGEQDDSRTHEAVWNYFASLIPSNFRENVAEYSIITDGPENLLAAVNQTANDPNLWALRVDIADVHDRANLTYTLIHEFGHLITLGPDQVPPSFTVFKNPGDYDIYLQEASACPDYFPGEGCSNPDSYINSFYNLFWIDIYDEWQQVNLIEDNGKYYEELDNFYNSYEEQFVTDYAVTNPEEDIAESWSFFVLGPQPAGDTIAEQKISFFNEYPELVQLRNEILNNLCKVYQ